MLVQLLVDNKKSWIVPYAIKLKEKIIKKFDFTVALIFRAEDVTKGDVLFLLSCEKIFNRLELNEFNLVVHESDVPKGKGWSPLSWQVLEGKKKIPITMFEAIEKVDAGKIYLQDFINLNGSELLDEIKQKQGQKTIDLILYFLSKLGKIKGVSQVGESTYYKKRIPNNSELDINKNIIDQFNHIRICDNERYPAFFKINNQKYILKIFKQNE